MSKRLIILIMFLCVNVCFAQDKKDIKAHPDFTGFWILQSVTVKPKSDADDAEYVDKRRRITQNETEFKIEIFDLINGRNIKQGELIYYTDGRGEHSGKLESKTKWDGNKIVTKSSDKTFHITYELSPDGNKLFETTVMKTKIAFSLNGKYQSTEEYKTIIKSIYAKSTENP